LRRSPHVLADDKAIHAPHTTCAAQMLSDAGQDGYLFRQETKLETPANMIR